MITSYAAGAAAASFYSAALGGAAAEGLFCIKKTGCSLHHLWLLIKDTAEDPFQPPN